MNCKISSLLLLAVGIACASPTGILLKDVQLDKSAILSKVFQGIILPKVITHLKQSIPQIQENLNSAKLNDPAQLGGFNLSLEYDSGTFPGERSHGFAAAQDITLHGVSEIVDDFNVAYNTADQTVTITWSATTPSRFRAEGNYELKHQYEFDFCLYGACNTIVIPSSGLGRWFIDMETPSASLAITLRMPTVGPMSVVSYEGMIDLASVQLEFEHYVVFTGDEFGPEDWEYISSTGKDLIDYRNEAAIRQYLNGQYKCMLDHVVNDCTLLDWIKGNWDCLKAEINLTCI